MSGEESAYTYQVPVRRALVNGRDAKGNLGLYLTDSGGGLVMPPPILGGATSGFHVMPNVADEVAILCEWPNRPLGVVSVVEQNQLALLPQLAPGESVAIATDGRQVGYLQASGATLLYSKPAGTLLSVAASGNVTLATPAGGAIALSATSSGTLTLTGAVTLNQTLTVAGATALSSTLTVAGATALSSTLTVAGVTTLSGSVQQAAGGGTWGVTAAGVATFGTLGAAATTVSTLHATGAAQLDSTLLVAGVTTLSGSVQQAAGGGTWGVTAAGVATFGTLGAAATTVSTLHATGAATLDATLVVAGATTVATLHATGAATLDATLAVGGVVTGVSAPLKVGAALMQGTLDLNNNTLGNVATITGTNISFTNTGGVLITNALNVGGQIYGNGHDLYLNNTTMQGTLNINNNTLGNVGNINSPGTVVISAANSVTLTSLGNNSININTTAAVIMSGYLQVANQVQGSGHALWLGSTQMQSQLDMNNQNIVNLGTISGGTGGFLNLNLQNQALKLTSVYNGGSKSGASSNSVQIIVGGSTFYIPYYT